MFELRKNNSFKYVISLRIFAFEFAIQMALKVVKRPDIFFQLVLIFVLFISPTILTGFPLLFFHFHFLFRRFLKLLCNTVVCQMSKFTGVINIVFHHCKSNVALFIDVHCEWVPICYEDPLTNVKLFLVNYQRILNILLHNPMSSLTILNILQNIIVFAKNGDSSASTLMPWLDNPKILVAINVILCVLFL